MERLTQINTELDRGEHWDQLAACAPLAAAGIFDEYFYPERYTRSAAHVIMAKRICAACPVRLECLEDALANDDNNGIKGGFTPLERKEHRTLSQISRHRGPNNAS